MTTEQINSIITQLDLGQEYFVWQMEEANSDMNEEARLEEFYELKLIDNLFSEDDEKVLALMEHTGDNWDDAESEVDINYKVLTDSEADAAVDDYLDQYIDDSVLANVDSSIAQYFDSEAWKFDNSSDRGSWLSHADGEEYEEEINGTTYYLYNL